MHCRSRRRSHLLGSLLSMMLLLTSTSFAADPPYLLVLEGPPVTVRYSPGALDRADQVQRRMERLVAELGHRKQRKQLLVVELLEAEEWRASGVAEPYGLPAISGAGTLALPAWGAPETVGLWRRLLGGGLPSISMVPLRGSTEEAASLEGADLVGEVEASRIVLSRLGLAGGAPWVDDLLACALAISAQRRHDPDRWAEVRQLHTRLASRAEALRDERLSRLRFVAAAERIGMEGDKPPAKPLLKMAAKSGGRLAAATLHQRYPWLVEWVSPAVPD